MTNNGHIMKCINNYTRARPGSQPAKKCVGHVHSIYTATHRLFVVFPRLTSDMPQPICPELFHGVLHVKVPQGLGLFLVFIKGTTGYCQLHATNSDQFRDLHSAWHTMKQQIGFFEG